MSGGKNTTEILTIHILVKISRKTMAYTCQINYTGNPANAPEKAMKK